MNGQRTFPRLKPRQGGLYGLNHGFGRDVAHQPETTIIRIASQAQVGCAFGQHAQGGVFEGMVTAGAPDGTPIEYRHITSGGEEQNLAQDGAE
ncbi:MAG TPA: hypothetical protein DEQ80_05935 [Anaerolinea thermolimosa]|uniref:Uncharacterized protein n=1 Tax=Anaerolinea thermolimosa TaxID=229919 RepID=A0A3D1JFM1_9CHLR|nr:hypothetical protein [Anaerolinea thermolimosa]